MSGDGESRSCAASESTAVAFAGTDDGVWSNVTDRLELRCVSFWCDSAGSVTVRLVDGRVPVVFSSFEPGRGGTSTLEVLLKRSRRP